MPGPTTWMPLYTRDLIASTTDMTGAQLGAYIRIICYAWDNGGCPNDMEACCRIAGGMSPSDWKVIRRRLVVLDEGTSEERLSQARLEEERAKCLAKYNAKVESLRKARNSNPNNGTVVSTDHSTVNSPDHSTDHSHQSQSQSHNLTVIENDSPTENLRATPQKRRRTYRIGWSLSAGFTGICDDDLKTWGSAYPGVNLSGEIAKANVYLRENPAKAGKRNWGAFLTRWFGRVQDKGGNAPSKPAPPKRWLDDYQPGEYQTPRQRAARARQKADHPADGISTLSDVIGRLNVSQGPQNEDHPN